MKGTFVVIIVLIVGFLIGSFTNMGSKAFSFLKTGEFTKTGSEQVSTLVDSAKNTITEITSVAQKQTGAVFDKQYLDAMITMYEGSVALSKIGTVAAGHGEIRTTAKTIAKDDAATLAQLKAWRKEWFPEEESPKPTTTKPSFVK